MFTKPKVPAPQEKGVVNAPVIMQMEALECGAACLTMIMHYYRMFIPLEQAKKYDAVLYKCGNRYILHRILKVREKDYVICGDHNIWREYGITDDQILGVMTRVIRDGKSIYPTDWKYKLYVHLWCDFYHVRAAILYTKMLIHSAGRRLKKLIKKEK